MSVCFGVCLRADSEPEVSGAILAVRRASGPSWGRKPTGNWIGEATRKLKMVLQGSGLGRSSPGRPPNYKHVQHLNVELNPMATDLHMGYMMFNDCGGSCRDLVVLMFQYGIDATSKQPNEGFCNSTSTR